MHLASSLAEHRWWRNTGFQQIQEHWLFCTKRRRPQVTGERREDHAQMRQGDSRLQAERRGLRRNQTWQDLDLDFQPSDCKKTHFHQLSHLDCGVLSWPPWQINVRRKWNWNLYLAHLYRFSGASSWRQSGSPPSLPPGGQICFILQLFTKGRALTKVKCSSN